MYFLEFLFIFEFNELDYQLVHQDKIHDFLNELIIIPNPHFSYHFSKLNFTNNYFTITIGNCISFRSGCFNLI